MAACMMIKPEADPDVDAERRAFAQKILAIQSLGPAQITREAQKKKKRQKPAGFRVAKVCTRAHFGDFEAEPTEEERRRARAQMLIARTLRQADRRRRRRRVKIFPLCVRSFPPLVTSYLRWIRSRPWLRWARMLRKQYSTSWVTTCPQADDDAQPLLPLACEGEWQLFD